MSICALAVVGSGAILCGCGSPCRCRLSAVKVAASENLRLNCVGGVLITIGLLTRPVAFILSGFMAAAYFMAHFPMSFFPAINMGEAALLYCFIFLYIAAAGPGPWSIDRD